ncbi:MAG: 2Fe-2S iron-sulfur cluster-binding protein [Candidatus Kapaibacterium sp.]
MSVSFYPLKVKDIRKETSDSASIFFEVPDDIKEKFEYKHGQYLTVMLELEGRVERRAFSISTSPNENGLLGITVKATGDGFFSRYMISEVRAGDEIMVMPPMGNFTIDLDEQNERIYIMLGGGSGITPLISILKTVMAAEPKSRIYLFYANRREEDIIFRENLDELMKKNPHRLEVIHILSQPSTGWIGPKGRLDSHRIIELLRKYAGDVINAAEYFICGPPGLMNQFERALDELAVPAAQRHKESFSTPVERIIEKASGEAGMDEDEELKTRKIRIKIYGEEHELTVDPDETVLTAAMREGYDPPFSCQIGACATCRAKLESGKVRMDAEDALTDEDKAEGYVLTCQSHPLTDDTYINYDES